MKVFSKEKFIENFTGEYTEYDISSPCSWLNVCDGKTLEECEFLGFSIDKKWMVDEICKYCVEGECVLINDIEDFLDASNYLTTTNVDTTKLHKTKINYCPMCGRKL